MDLDTPETCRGWRNILRKNVHQVGFSLHGYIEMHGQQNIKYDNYHCRYSLRKTPKERRFSFWFSAYDLCDTEIQRSHFYKKLSEE